ncbi:guanine nucleotide exchange factor subunit RIC1-like isoform X2 [Lineus longissimus]|uniref:guanine nucleotide exchange factor subunit RIC1-like isoform X2 n=1 Tax=Lineus longissimus TaxID=88925 RepID=UPI00315CCB15
MYFTVEWPKHIRIPQQDPSPLVHVSSNRDRLLFAVLTANSLSIWFCKPSVEIVCFRRSVNSVTEFGSNQRAEWRPDSSMVAVTTSRGYIIFYKLEVDLTVINHHCLYTQREGGKSTNQKELSDIHNGDGIPALSLTQASYMQIPGGVASMACIKDDIMVASGFGTLQRIRWDGFVNGDLSVSLNAIPFSIDLQHSRASTINDDRVHISAMEYSSQMGGFAVVLSNGSAAFITATSPRFEPNQIMGVWAGHTKNATCVAVNSRFRLIALGCSNGEGLLFCIDELTGALQISHKLMVSSKDYPDACNSTGGVSILRWTPDGCTIAMAWEKGGYSIWSVFGALLVCTLATDFSFAHVDGKHFVNIQSMEWGMEGFHLWVVSGPNKSDGGNRDILQIQFVKSALSANPCMTNHEHLLLQGEDRLYINTGVHVLKTNSNAMAEGLSPTKERPGQGSIQSQGINTILIGNKQWQVIPIPHNYLASNWPIKYCAADRSGQCIAIAGKAGLCHYAAFNKKWKLFGNETQEKDMVVSGGMTWWKDFICLSCFNLLDQREEIRLYPRSSKLDNTFAHIHKLPSPVLLLNTFRDILIVFCADCHIMLYNIERKNTQPNPSVELQKLQEVSIGSFIPQASSVTAITLTSLRTETAPIKAPLQPREAESILLNYAGKLLMFQRDRTGPQVQRKDGKNRPLPFCAPVMVASSVENMWSTSRSNPDKKYLMDALWLCCGAQGVKVWLPLLSKEEVKTPAYMSKRIMLPFSVDIYPLSVLFEDCVILGVTNDTTSYEGLAAEEAFTLPFSTLERTSQIYLHHILRQLLRRNLGIHALEIARCCTDLPYFAHVLELLVHEVLEEEATSKEPIPDPLLPRVVAFIQEFPEYLQTIVHCARKTEVALWPYLFSTTGNPKDLFEECLVSGNLDTAASYLIILQNLEKPMVSRQHATLLLDASLDHCKWELARDLVRFLTAIDPSEAETPPNFTLHTKQSIMPGSLHPPGSLPSPCSLHTPPISPSETSAYGYGNTSRGRSTSLPKNEPPKDAGRSKEKKLAHSESQMIPKRHPSGPLKEEGTQEQFFIDVILSRHARKLLSAHRLRDLGQFSANLDDYKLVAWLRKEKVRAAKVDDFVAALKQLHHDFLWPLPILTHAGFHHLHKSFGGLTCLDMDDDGDEVFPSLLVPTSSTSSKGSSCSDTQRMNGDQDCPLTVNIDGGPAGSAVREHHKLNRQPTDLLATPTGDVMLKPQVSVRDDSSLATELSENSSLLGEGELMLDQSAWGEVSFTSELEQITQELANKGPPQSELELRYLFHIMLEADCLEWAVIIAIILRDAIAVVRAINTASLTDAPIEVIGRIREGISFLELWAETECLGYKPFLVAIKGQSLALAKIAEEHPPKSRLSTSSLESSATTEELKGAVNSSHCATDHSDNEERSEVTEEEEEEPEAGGQCSVS